MGIIISISDKEAEALCVQQVTERVEHSILPPLQEGRPKAVLAQVPPLNLRLHPSSSTLMQLHVVLVFRLRRQQGPGGQMLDTEGRAVSQTQSKLQDGCNNNILAHACSRGCSS